MTVYMNRIFRKSNSSFLLSSGKAITSKVTRLKDDNTFLISTGITPPKITPSDQLLLPKNNNNDHVTSFYNTVGFMQPSSNESLPKTQMLERLFMDLVAGDDNIKERALGRFNDFVGGSMETVPGEASILMPRRFRQFQAWNELKKIWQGNKKVKGFLMEKVRGGYSVAIAGYIAFVPFRPFIDGVIDVQSDVIDAMIAEAARHEKYVSLHFFYSPHSRSSV
ncbi:hypothetical protein Tco_0525809 [Tanacetum coccineum]